MIQEGCFYYLFGITEIDYYACIELDTEQTTLFLPKSSAIKRAFQSPPRKAEIAKKYGVNALYQSKMKERIKEMKPVSVS